MEENTKTIHGSFDVRIFEQVAAVRVYGSWNDECARAYREYIVEKSRHLQNKPYISIIDLRQWGLATPEALSFLAQEGNIPPTYDRSIGGIREIELGNPDSYSMKISAKKIVGNKPGILYLETPEQVIQKLKELRVLFDKDDLYSFLTQKSH